MSKIYDFGVAIILILSFINYLLIPAFNYFDISFNFSLKKNEHRPVILNCHFGNLEVEEEDFENDISLEFEVEEEEVDLDEDLELVEETENIPDQLFCPVEEGAHPVGGYSEFYKFIKSKLRYPKEAKENGIEGRVYIQFEVSKNGELCDVKCIRGIGHGCDKAAVEVIKKSDKWIPGKQRGKEVRQRIVLPINFKL